MREYWTNNTYTHLPHLLPHSHLLLFSFLGQIAMCLILGLVTRLSLLGPLLNPPLGPIGIHNASLVFIRVLLQGLARARYRKLRYRGFSGCRETTGCSVALVVGSWLVDIAELFFSWTNLMSDVNSSF